MSQSDAVTDGGLLGEIHVWRASADLGCDELERLWDTLSDDERERAQRFRFARDRQRFVARRGLVRAILGQYLSTGAHALRFAYGRFGKPALVCERDRPALEFSLSHSAGLLLLALTGREGVGVDIEQVDTRFDYRGVAEQFFPPQVIEELRWALPAQAHRVFFRQWSLQEAIGKARGDGLAVLRQRQSLGSGPMHACSATALDIADGFAAGLAMRGKWELRPQPWRESLARWKACYRVGLHAW
jgi:4'-phosphopantetheinyl transferase